MLSHTQYQALHFIFAYNFEAQYFLHSVIIFVSSSTSSNDTKFFGFFSIQRLLIGFQSSYEFKAPVDLVRIEFQEMQASTKVF